MHFTQAAEEPNQVAMIFIVPPSALSVIEKVNRPPQYVKATCAVELTEFRPFVVDTTTSADPLVELVRCAVLENEDVYPAAGQLVSDADKLPVRATVIDARLVMSPLDSAPA
jgi:predicted ABC-class ATPase